MATEPPEEIPEVPENAQDRSAAWNRLIRCLFAVLSQAVDRRDRDACDRFAAILIRWWDDALSLDGTADLFGIPPERLKDQWRTAGFLTRCAQWIVKQPSGQAWVARPDLDQAIAQAIPGDLPAESGFDPVTTWGWIASLRRARVVYWVKVPVVLIDPMRPGAVVAELRLELIEGVVGGAFRDPEQALVGVFAPEFRDAMATAWDAGAWAFHAEAGNGDDRRRLSAGRYRLEYPGKVDPSRLVDGRSAGGAAAYGWWHALRHRQPDSGVAVLAEVERDEGDGADRPRFGLASVEGIDEKIRALTESRARDRTVDTIVTAGQMVTFDCPARFFIADEVSTDQSHGLLACRSALVVDLLKYLDNGSGRADELPAYFPEKLRQPGGFDRIRQRVQVVNDRRDWDRWWAEQRERLRASGQDPEAMAYEPTRSYPEHDDRKGDRPGRDGSASPRPPETVFWDDLAAERFRRSVILGDPGFGKTWLLLHEARRVARLAVDHLGDHRELDKIELPVLVRMFDLGRELSKSSVDSAAALAQIAVKDFPWGPSDYEKDPTGCRKAEFEGQLRLWLNDRDRKAVVLLDAWDEAHPEDNRKLLEWLKSFAKYRSNCRLLVTSRIVGYTGNVVPDAQELELLAFDQAQVDAFIAAWFDGHVPGPLRDQLRLWPSLRGLSRIPLLLSMVCGVFQKQKSPASTDQAEIPTRRTELYERCLKGLLRDWKVWDKLEKPISLERLHATLELWSRVALRQFEQGPKQVDRSRFTEMVQDELQRLIYENPSHELCQSNASSLIEGAKNDGLLIVAGQDDDAPLLFLHRTFQEYFAARELARQAKGMGWVSVADRVDRWSWHPRWESVIPLLAGQLDDPAPLLELLAEEQRDDLFRHRLATAASSLPELSADRRTRCLALVDRIVDETFNSWWKRWKIGARATVEHLTRALSGLTGVGRMPVEIRLLEKLRDDDKRVWEAARAAVGAMMNGSTDVIRPLLDYPGVFSGFADGVALRIEGVIVGWALEKLAATGIGTDLVEALFDCVQSNRPVRRAAAEGLGSLVAAGANRELVDRLFGLLLHHDVYVADSARRALKRLGASAKSDAIDALLARLVDADREVRLLAVEGIGSIGPSAASPAVIDALVAGLHDEDWDVQYECMYAVGELGMRHARRDEVVDYLLACLDDEREHVQIVAVGALCKMGAAVRIDVFRELVAIINQEEKTYKYANTTHVFEKLDVAGSPPEIIDALIACLRGGDGDLPAIAADALGMSGPLVRPQVVEALVDALRSSDGLTREDAVKSLEKLGQAATPAVIEALLESLADDDEFVRYAAANALGSVVCAALKQEVIGALLDRFRVEKKEQFVRDAIAVSLGELASAEADTEILETLLAWHRKGLISEDKALEALGRLGPAPEVIGMMTSALDKDVADKSALFNELEKRRADEALGRMMISRVRIRCLDGRHLICDINSLVDCKLDGRDGVLASATEPPTEGSTSREIPEGGLATSALCNGCAPLHESSRSG